MPSPVEEQQAGTAPPAEQALPAGEKETGPEQSEELAAPAIPAPPPVQVPDRYDLLRCTLHFSITMLEDDGDPAGRRVILGVRNDEDDPMTRMVRATGPEALLATLIDLPRRQEAMRARLEKTQRARQQAPKTAQKGAHPASPPSPPPLVTRQGEGTSQDTAPTAAAPAPKSATPARRGAKGQEESPFEQMSLFGE